MSVGGPTMVILDIVLSVSRALCGCRSRKAKPVAAEHQDVQPQMSLSFLSMASKSIGAHRLECCAQDVRGRRGGRSFVLSCRKLQ